VNTRKRAILFFMAGLGLTIGGTYVTNHIGTIFEGQQWSFQVIAGLGIGATPVIIGVFIMVVTVISVVADFRLEQLKALTLPSPKERGFSDYAQADASRWRLRGLPDPIHSSGLDFPRKPNFRNHPQY